MDNIKNILKKILYAFLCGSVMSWLLFWWLSGSPIGIFKYLVVQQSATMYFMDPVNREKVFEGALKGMIEALNEPHSRYLDEDEFKNMMAQTESSYSGVGIVMGKKTNGMEVISAIDDSPAALAGIKNGDVIVAIDGESIEKLSSDMVGARIRGEEGTTVTLRIRRQNEESDYVLIRQKIVLPTVKEKILDNHIGYIRISQFAEKTGADFKTAYLNLRGQGITALIVDLRNNPGGLLAAAQEVSNYLIPKGTLVSIKDRSGTTKLYESEGLGEKIPLVVLVNSGSASASEIIAGAVQDLKVGTIIGTKTYGKGTVQTVIPVATTEAVKITIAKYHTPNDRVIDGIGIEPDVVVNGSEQIISEADDLQLLKAKEILLAQ